MQHPLSPLPCAPQVQGSHYASSSAAGRLKDRKGVDYTVPRAKSSTVATLTSSAAASGKHTVSFSRPFKTNADGVELREDGFVWLMCAYRWGSSDMDAKHR